MTIDAQMMQAGRIALLLAFCSNAEGAQIYSDTSPRNGDFDRLVGTPTLSVMRSDGKSMRAPKLSKQIAFDSPRVSPDGKRVGWLTLMPNCCTSYPVPMALVILKGDKIERVIKEDQCIFEWTFERGGSAVAYWSSALHGTDYKAFVLRDIRSGKVLDRYTIPESELVDPTGEAKRADAVDAAPSWVKEVP